jgi:hypothetical protein
MNLECTVRPMTNDKLHECLVARGTEFMRQSQKQNQQTQEEQKIKDPKDRKSQNMTLYFHSKFERHDTRHIDTISKITSCCGVVIVVVIVVLCVVYLVYRYNLHLQFAHIIAEQVYGTIVCVSYYIALILLLLVIGDWVLEYLVYNIESKAGNTTKEKILINSLE